MRLKQLDFLRGIAVLLVLLRHYALSDVLFNIGWVGVDFFFVLSGFLVSGLLFNEYIKYGNIKPLLFLIRRGLKIYPLFYFALILSIILISYFNYIKWTDDNLFRGGLLAEFLFLQNYFGHIWDHTWSLAVEEHFYILLVIIIFILTKVKKELQKAPLFIAFFLFIGMSCFILRFFNYQTKPFTTYTHVFATHLRIDSLMFGVFLSYLYHYHKKKYTEFFVKYKIMLLVISGLIMVFPFLFKIETFFMNTFGLTLLYLGFGIILSVMVVNPNSIKTLNKIIGTYSINIISKIGFYSYSIYLWHIIVLYCLTVLFKNLFIVELPIFLMFLIYFFSSILIAIGASKLVEQKFLKYRDRKFPSRSKSALN